VFMLVYPHEILQNHPLGIRRCACRIIRGAARWSFSA
jgi:hypothetical protein